MKKASDYIKKRRISPDDSAQYFFGYYDLQAYDADCRRHLCHRVSFMDRLPQKDDVAELGYIDLVTGKFNKFAETTAWNFQQGAMLQWNPKNPRDEVIYNIREGGEYRCVTQNLVSGKIKTADRAVANVSPDGKWGLSINFDRVYDFRPGYGYGGVRDRFYDIPQPSDDGVFLVDLDTGKSRLIIDYARIVREFGNPEFAGAKFVVNHITFNTDSNRFLFLNRNFQTPENPGWKTSLITSDLEGNMKLLLDSTMVSHYNWKNGSQILAYAKAGDENGIYLIDDITGKAVRLDSPCFKSDIHCIYSPDLRYIIGDGYPDREQRRTLYIYDTETDDWDILAKVFSVKPPVLDIRCDLHALWSRDGRKISYDSTETGKREIYELDVSYLYAD